MTDTFDIREFIPATFQHVRSSKRTDLLHKCITEELYKQRPELRNCSVLYEYKHPDMYGGTFDVDIAFFNEAGICILIVLAKAPNSSIGKNIKNYGNTTVGEAARAMCTEHPPAELLFINVLPRVAPILDKDSVSGFDDMVKKMKETDTQPALTMLMGDAVKVRNIFYDIVDVRDKVSKDEFWVIDFENLEIPEL